jgi:hypothetical protein
MKEFTVQDRYEQAVAEFLIEVASKKSNSFEGKNYIREGMISKRFESDMDLTFSLKIEQRPVHVETATHENIIAYFNMSNLQRNFNVVSSFKLPAYVEDIPAARTCRVLLNPAREKTIFSHVKKPVDDIEMDIVSVFLTMLTSQWDLSYAGRSVKYIDRSPVMNLLHELSL